MHQPAGLQLYVMNAYSTLRVRCALLSYIIIADAEATNLYACVQDDTACWRSSTAWPECSFSGGGTRCHEGAQRHQEVELTGPVQYSLKLCYLYSASLYTFTRSAARTSAIDLLCCNAKIRSLCVCTALWAQANLDSKGNFTHQGDMHLLPLPLKATLVTLSTQSRQECIHVHNNKR